VKVQKVRAHPERHLHHSKWTWDDKGIWTADRVAGGNMPYECTVRAAKWLKKIGSRSLVVLEELDGTPFIGSVRDRVSKRSMGLYWVERDRWRAKDGLSKKWEGTNIAHAFSLLKRNGGLEDHATMLRLASGKQWEYQRYNYVACKACQGEFRGSAHPLLRCSNLSMVNARNLWKNNCYEHVKGSKPARLRGKLLEILHHVFSSEGGEFAALGTFIPGWVGKVDDGSIMPVQDLNSIKKLLRAIAGGARLVMREFARLKEVSEGDPRKGSKELRQLSINQFAKPITAPKPKKVAACFSTSNSPPDSVWESSPTEGRRLIWVDSVNQSDSITAPNAGNRGSRTGGANNPSSRTKPNPWKGGLNWFSPRRKQGSC
jgi:hypothetical protein